MQACMETLRRIAANMGPQSAFQGSLKSLLRLLAERHAFVRPHLVIYDPQSRTLRLRMADTAPRNEQVMYEPGVGVTGQVFASGQPVIVDCMADHSVFLSKFFPRTDAELHRLAFICVPILVSGDGPDKPSRVIGTLNVDTERATAEELAEQCCFLEVVAAMIATQAAYLQEETERQHRVAAHALREAAIPGAEQLLVQVHEGVAVPLMAVSPGMRRVVAQAVQAWGRGAVLVVGEAGSGRATLAAAMHSAGPRRAGPFMVFRGAGLSDTQAEQALFGYRKGAFSGAVQSRKGLLEQAHTGTLYIADIDTLPPRLMAGLVRVLDERQLLRCGAAPSEAMSVDVRLVGSMEQAVSCGPRTRAPEHETPPNMPDMPDPARPEDAAWDELYQRMAACTMCLPPLRERREDVVPLAQYFVQAARARHAPLAPSEPLTQAAPPEGEPGPHRAVPPAGAPQGGHLSPAVVAVLEHHAWPGNVRELKNCMERAARLCPNGVIQVEHLPSPLRALAASIQPRPLGGDMPADLSFTDAVEDFERRLLMAALQQSGGNVLQAARTLHTSYRIIHYKVRKYQIDPRIFSDSELV